MVFDSTKALKCRYTQNYKDEYMCTIDNQHFSLEDEVTFDTTNNGKMFTNNHEVLQIVFDDVKLSYVPNQIFKIFPNVETLFLEQTGLTNWKREFLEGAKRLKTLSIWSSFIKYFGEEAFAEVPQLSSLSIWMSEIRTLSPEMFKHFTNLTELDLRQNIFIYLPDNAFDPVAATVSYINLSRTNLEKIPLRMFKKFGMLVELDLTENNLLPIDASRTFPEKLQKVSVCKFFNQ